MQTEHLIALVSAIRDKANRFIFEQLKARGIKDIVPAHGGVFFHLFGNRELTMGEIARLIHRDKSTVTSLVEKLGALGYIRRERDAVDRRVTKIRLTQKGRLLEADFADISRSLLSKAYLDFSDKEMEVIVKLLTRVNNNF
jgi:DNA-binding MarR family transcriptional regulator